MNTNSPTQPQVPIPLTETEIAALLGRYPPWRIIETDDPKAADGIRRELYRSFVFPSYNPAFAFMCHLSQQVIVPLDHHPTWCNRWNRVEIWLTTSDVGFTLSTLDAEFVAGVEQIWAEST